MIGSAPGAVLLHSSGHEIALLTGDAEWDSDSASAKAIVAALLGS